jgi:uncharacterized protein YdhG (YjbR/CyaY superfamily)
MTRADFRSVSEYIASHPRQVRAVLRRVRGAIRRAVPGAEETIRYGIPAFNLHGRHVVYFAGWKEHYSLYPAGARLVAAFGDELAPYRAGRGTIRFPLSEPVPVRLIERVTRFLAKEAAERGKTKRAASKRRG